MARGRLLRLGGGVWSPARLVPANGRLALRSWWPAGRPLVLRVSRVVVPRPRRSWILITVTLFACLLGFLGWELRTSRLQSRYFVTRAARLTWTVGDGGSASPLQAPQGPYDLRHGYARLRDMQARLESNGFRVARQAAPSNELRALVAQNIAPPYREKNSAGLQILDDGGRTLFDARPAHNVFREFVDIPPLIVHALLYVEDRTLLDDSRPRMNPALEWDRLLISGWRYALDNLFETGNTSGGSTLATQVQKFRHSPQGRTAGVQDKLHQMLGASYAAYRGGEDTRAARRRIVLDYVNGLPLGAAAEVGEVVGLGEGLRVWFGKSLEQLVVDLSLPEEREGLTRKAESTKQALALLLATRRPSLYLGSDRTALEQRLEFYWDELVTAGIVTPELATAARALPLALRHRRPQHTSVGFADRKATNAIRTDLLDLLGMRGYYDLDHLDLRVQTTLDIPAQTAVLATLHRMRDPAFLARNGLFGERLLGDGDPTQVIYTFSLYGSDPSGNRLLVHADDLDRPLDLNDMSKLELGSTAKLRTMASYLMVIAALHERLGQVAVEERWKVAQTAPDPLTRWAAGWLGAHPEAALDRMLEASLERTYSADPEAQFFTGSGLHTFENFDDKIEGDVPLRLGFRHSVNLVFIRLMRDLVSYYTAARGYDEHAILENRNHPERVTLLESSVARESRAQLLAAYEKYRDLGADAAVRKLCGQNGRQLERFAVFYLAARSEARAEELVAAAGRLFPARASEFAAAAPRLLRAYGQRSLSLSDQGWLMKRDPLEIWLVRDRERHPAAKFAELAERSAEVRRDAFAWLFNKGAWRSQNIRLRIEMERKAFEGIHAAWRELGYPFGSLVPSLATAIGSSADRPAALAELVGILQNDGLRAPTHRITAVHFGEDTPYETHFASAPPATERVMPAEVARTLKTLMQDAVENGTAVRARGAVQARNGTRVAIGGKTGSGDNRYETFAADGTLLTSRAISRTASFVFFIGDRHYGVITAHVAGESAGDYTFTSSLALQAFKVLAPSIQPLLDRDQRHAGVSNSRSHVAP